jgi:hypothetical protein
MYDQRNCLIYKWGKDQTGKIEYHINSQGFRSRFDYNFVPQYAFFGSSSLFGIGVQELKILVSYFDKSHNYGLAGKYLNIDSVYNLESFIQSKIYDPNTVVVFFYINRDREGIEFIPDIYSKVIDLGHKNIIHISQGEKYPCILNLMPAIDFDISKTHPGPKTHALWAKTIKLIAKCYNK